MQTIETKPQFWQKYNDNAYTNSTYRTVLKFCLWFYFFKQKMVEWEDVLKITLMTCQDY